MKPYYETELGKLYHGDCLEIMPELGSVDLIVTSPPYNCGKEYGDSYKDSKAYNDYLDWLDCVWDCCFSLAKDGRRMCINVADLGRNPYFPIHSDITARIREKWFLMGTVVWNKQNCMSNTAWGSWRSPSAPGLRGLHEYIIIAGKGGKFYKPDFKKEPKKFEPEMEKKEFLEFTLEVWNFSPDTKKNGHPTKFPVELPRRCILLFCYPDDVVLDPFSGSGTTPLSCERLNRRWIGIEIEEKYCEIAAKRIENERKQLKLWSN